jgi:hypothetical protein
MGWKSLAWAGCLAPALAGCGTTHTAHDLTGNLLAAHAQRGIEHDLRRDAREAWRCVRRDHPRRAFTAEFHDGFLDGFVDYLDRGGCAQPPAVPPLKYVRNKKYFTPEGHCLVQDYYLGFKYGADVALATGRRQFLTVPVLLAEQGADCQPGPNPFTSSVAPVVPFVTAPGSPTQVRPMPLPAPRPVSPSDAKPGGNKFGEPRTSDDPLLSADEPPARSNPDVPPVRPLNPTPRADDPSKFAPPPPNLDLLPVPSPPVPTLPVPSAPANPEIPVPDSSGLAPGPVPTRVRTAVPQPPDEVPTLPDGAPTPSILDDIPVVPFRFVSPQPLPPTIPIPLRK